MFTWCWIVIISILEMENNIEVVSDLSAQYSHIRGNCYGISNALQNIILNAVQAIHDKVQSQLKQGMY